MTCLRELPCEAARRIHPCDPEAATCRPGELERHSSADAGPGAGDPPRFARPPMRRELEGDSLSPGARCAACEADRLVMKRCGRGGRRCGELLPPAARG